MSFETFIHILSYPHTHTKKDFYFIFRFLYFVNLSKNSLTLIFLDKLANPNLKKSIFEGWGGGRRREWGGKC